MDNDLAFWLALWRQPYIGPSTLQKLLASTEDLSVFFKGDQFSSQLKGYVSSRALKTPPNWHGVEADLAWLQASSLHHIIKITSPLYSPRLREIPQAPALLFVKGSPATLSLPQIGMVGSRHPTAVGFEDAFSFAKSLSEQGIVVTSGLAIGIDTASHKGALAGGGLTVAVLGHGLDQVYPSCNEALAEKIVDSGGALISEYPIGVEIQAKFFPKRNGIISGLSMGIFVVEAALKSGSLITANYALEQGREVFAMPGSVHNPLAKGCNSLIRQGAKCVETAEHLMEEVQNIIHISYYEPKPQKIIEESSSTESPQFAALPSEQQQLLAAIDYACTPIDSIIERSGLTLAGLSHYLLEMELEGLIAAVPGGYIRHTIKEGAL